MVSRRRVSSYKATPHWLVKASNMTVLSRSGLSKCLEQMMAHPVRTGTTKTTERVILTTGDGTRCDMWLTTAGVGWSVHLASKDARLLESFCGLPVGAAGPEMALPIPTFNCNFTSWFGSRSILPDLLAILARLAVAEMCGCSVSYKPQGCDVCTRCLLAGEKTLGDCPICFNVMHSAWAAETGCCHQHAHTNCLAKVGQRCCFCRHEPLVCV